MRIIGGHVKNFGIFHDMQLPELNPGMVVIYGPNEAGKSTLMAFIRQMLFKFRKANQAGYYSTRNGDSPEGALHLHLDREGTRFDITRRGVQGGFAEEQVLLNILGGLTMEAHQSLYAVSLEELKALDEQGDRLLESFFQGASLGINPAKLKQVTDSLEKRADDIYKPRGRVQRLNVPTTEYARLEAELKEVGNQVKQYDELSAHLEKLEASVQQLESSRREDLAQLNRLQRLKDAWGTYILWSHANDQQQLQGEAPLSGYTELWGKYARLAEEAATLTNRRKQKHDELELKRSGLSLLPVLDIYPANAEEIRRLAGGVEFWKKSLEEVQAFELQMDRQEEQKRNALSQLGTGWTLDRALRIPTGIKVSDEVASFESELATSEESVRQLSIQVSGLNAKRQEAMGQLTESRTRLKALSPSSELLSAEVAEKLSALTVQVQEAIQTLPERRQKFSREENVLNQELRDLAAGWDHARLDSFDASIAAQSRLKVGSTALADSRAKLHEATRELQRATAMEAEAAKELELLINHLKGAVGKAQTSTDNPTAHRALYRKLRELLRIRTDLESRLYDLENSLRQLRTNYESMPLDPPPAQPKEASKHSKALLIVGIILLVAGIALLFNPAVPSPVGIVLALLGTVLIALYFTRANSASTTTTEPAPSLREVLQKGIQTQIDEVQIRIQDHRTKIGECDSRIAQESTGYTLPSPLGNDLLDRLEDELLQQELELGRARQMEAERAKLESQLTRRREELRTALAAVELVRNELKAAEDQWRQSMEDLGLPTDWTPDLVHTLFQRIPALREKKQRWTELGESIAQLEQRIHSACEFLQSIGAELSASSNPELILRTLQSTLTQHQQNLLNGAQRLKVQEEVTRHEALLSTAEKLYSEGKTKLDLAQNSLQSIQQKWEQWLSTHDFDPKVDPDHVNRVFVLLEKLRISVSDHERLSVERDKCLEAARRFRISAEHLFAQLSTPMPNDDPSIWIHLLDFQRTLTEQLSIQEKRKALQAEYDLLQRQLEEINSEIGVSSQAINEVLTEANCDSPEELQHLSIRQQEQEKLLASLQEAERNLLSETGLRTIESVREAFAVYTEEAAIEADLSAIKTRCESHDATLRSLYEELSRVRDQVDDMATDKRLGELRLRQEALKEQIHELTREWLVLRTAQLLITTARNKFEEERQPALLRLASEKLAIVTGGRYKAVRQTLTEKGRSLQIIIADDQAIPPSLLSRGTRDQVYLLLRLGVALQRAGEAQQESLPLILDDVLVNFDDHRVERAMETFHGVEDAVQVIIFTCHRRVATAAKALNAQVLRLGDNKLVDWVG